MIMKDQQFADNFWLSEFLVSNDFPDIAEQLCPNIYHVDNLYLLCYTILQPTRDHFNCAMNVSSGYRNEKLNILVQGSFKSLHLYGKAVDIYPENLSYLKPMYNYIKKTMPYAFIELIWYKQHNFIHIGLPHINKSRLLKINE